MAWFYLSKWVLLLLWYIGFRTKSKCWECISLDTKIKEIIMDTWFQIRLQLEVTLDGT